MDSTRRSFLLNAGLAGLSGLVLGKNLYEGETSSVKIVRPNQDANQRGRDAANKEIKVAKIKGGIKLNSEGEVITADRVNEVKKANARRDEINNSINYSETETVKTEAELQELREQQRTIERYAGMAGLGLSGCLTALVGKDSTRKKEEVKTNSDSKKPDPKQEDPRLALLHSELSGKNLFIGYLLVRERLLSGRSNSAADIDSLLYYRDKDCSLGEIKSLNFTGLAIRLMEYSDRSRPNLIPSSIDLVIARNSDDKQLYMGWCGQGDTELQQMQKIRDVDKLSFNGNQFSVNEMSQLETLLGNQFQEFTPTKEFDQLTPETAPVELIEPTKPDDLTVANPQSEPMTTAEHEELKQLEAKIFIANDPHIQQVNTISTVFLSLKARQAQALPRYLELLVKASQEHSPTDNQFVPAQMVESIYAQDARGNTRHTKDEQQQYSRDTITVAKIYNRISEKLQALKKELKIQAFDSLDASQIFDLIEKYNYYKHDSRAIVFLNKLSHLMTPKP